MSIEAKRSTAGLCIHGAALGLIAACLQYLVRPLVGDHVPFLFFLPVLIWAAFSSGSLPAAVVLLIGAANAALLGPSMGLRAQANSQDIAALVIYVLLGALLIVYGSRLRSSTRRAALAEGRLAIAQDNTGVGVFDLDFESRTAYISPSMSRILRQPVSAEPISLDHWLGRLRPEHVMDTQQALQERLAKGELRYEREQQITLPNGDVIWVLNRVQIEAGPDGRLAHARGAAVDITERKKADDLLKAAQVNLQRTVSDLERLHAFSQNLVRIAEGLPTALRDLLDLLVDLHAGRHGVVSLCDPDATRLFAVAHAGFSEDVLRRAAAESPSSAAVQGLATVGEALVDDESYRNVLIRHHELAVLAGLSASHSMPLVGTAGEVMGAISIMFDEPREQGTRESRCFEACAATAAAVVERERARAHAVQTEQRFYVALESSVVPFSLLTPVRQADGRIVDFEWTYLNPAAQAALGRDRETLLGRRITDVLPRAWDVPGQFERYVQCVEHGDPAHFEINSGAANPGVRWYHVVVSPLQGSIAVWFANITDRKLHENALEAADQRKDEFLATLAHEIRNPLAAIRQGLSVARAIDSTDLQKRRGHAVIERQVQHLSLLVDDLLDVARVGRGTLLLRKSRESLSSVIDTAIEVARPHIDAKRHQLTLEIPREPVLIEVDPLRLAQVMSNLLINAAKYTDQGGHIEVRATFDAQGLVIRISDDGIGLTQDQQRHIFNMFSQVSSAMDKSQNGLGIGLALARGLMELHGGSIEVSSDGPGRGAEFTVRLPGACVVNGGAPATAADAVPAEQTHLVSRRRILIADDNRDAADTLAELLRLDGHEVAVAYDGEEALAAFLQFAPHVALLDVGMPRLSGLEVGRAIRQNPAGRLTTLIAITGRGEDRERRMILEAGFDHHITKPADPARIAILIGAGPTGLAVPAT